MGDRDIAELLAELGFADTAAMQAARGALEQAGLTSSRKTRVSEEKIPRIAALLDQTFARCCPSPACRGALARLKPAAQLLAVADPRNCEHCGGSDNLKAVRLLAEACRRRGISRIVVVGGSPSVREEILALKPQEWELRLVDGTERRTLDRARADLDWAHLVLIWGSSELDHKVSKLYTDATGPARRKVVHTARRGVAALFTAGAEHLARQG